MSVTGIQALLDVSLSYMNEARDASKSTLLSENNNKSDIPTENLTTEETKFITETLTKLFNNKIDIQEAMNIINPIVGTQLPMQKVAAILSIKDEPIPTKPEYFTDVYLRHKTRPWILYEDQRLLAAILRYGFENWVMVAEFVGNGRTRSQCSQRWNRGLNPKISKGSWSKEDEEKLLRLVAENGYKSWTKISNEFGNRSDVQCRYRYQQLQKESQNCNTNSNNLNNNKEENPPPLDNQLKVEESKEKNNDFENKQIRHFLPSLSPQPPPLPFVQQNQTQTNNSAHQEAILPKMSLPKIDPSIFMEC